MADIVETIISSIATMPVEHLAIFLGLAGITLAAFAIHAVLTVIKRKGDR